jgi:hypothetical protein
MAMMVNVSLLVHICLLAEAKIKLLPLVLMLPNVFRLKLQVLIYFSTNSVDVTEVFLREKARVGELNLSGQISVTLLLCFLIMGLHLLEKHSLLNNVY